MKKNIKHTISIWDTYRYCDAALYCRDNKWVTVKDLKLGKLNYVGQGHKDYNAMMIEVPNLDFSGVSSKFTLDLYLYVSSPKNHTFRWAITTSKENEFLYTVGCGDVEDEYQLASGSFTPEYYRDKGRHWQSFDFECDKISPNTPLYIYMWRDNKTYGNVHVEADVKLDFEYVDEGTKVINKDNMAVT